MIALASDLSLLRNLLLFGRTLRRAGIPVSPVQSRAFVEALEWTDLGDRQAVFHTARALLVYRHEDLRLFETLFQRFWRAPGAGGPRTPRPRRAERPRRLDPRPVELASYLARKASPEDPEVDISDRRGTFSRLESLRRKDFSEMNEEELAAVRRLIQEARWKAARRRTRRLVADARGNRIDLRAILREAARRGGVATRLAYRRRKIQQRPFVLLADVSGSMERYSRLLLQLFYGISQSFSRVESFVFGTRLTRITPQLELRNIDRALEAASLEVMDWAGGTRIGESLGSFNREWSRRVLRRGAVVVIVSDGWERGDAGLLAREMRYLSHRCHRLVWLNPLLGATGYRPLVSGMSAALPYVDDFLPIHNLDSLAKLADHLASLPERRSGRASHPLAGQALPGEPRGA